MKALEIEIRCPECGGTVLWKEQQVIASCMYCGSLLYFEPDLEHRFYVEPVVRTSEDARQVLVLSRAEKKRAEIAGITATGSDDADKPRMITAMDLPLAPFVKLFEARIVIRQASLIYVPYWHFQGTLFQNLLAVSSHGTKEHQYRRAAVDQALPAYDPTCWNFRDRGLRFKDARFKEVTSQLLASTPHIAFSKDMKAVFDRILRAHPPVESGSHYTFKHHALCHQRRMPILRPYWIVRFECEGEETVLVDGCFGTIAGYPKRDEAEKLFGYRERPHAVASTPALKVLSSRCPVCGADTRWAPSETIHFCANCGRALILRSGEVQVQPYFYQPAPGGSCLHIPFWKFRVHLKHQRKEYRQLGDYFRLFFQDRWLKGRTFSHFLHIPAVRIKRAKQGDLLLSALIASAASAEMKEMEGPLQPPPDIRFGEMDVVAASEMLSCSLPSAAGVAPALVKAGDMVQMLKETTVRFDQASLVLIPIERRRNDLIVNGKPFSLALLAGA